MKTEVVMKREFFGMEIAQKSKSKYFSASDLSVIGDMWRAKKGLKRFNMTEWLKNKSTKEYITELENRFDQPAIIPRKKRNSHLWVHPLLFIDIALAINPTFKVDVYQWLFDHLIEFRNDSGDSYKKMCGALYLKTTNKRNFPEEISNVALQIRIECGDVKSWQKATEKQLKTRDKMHEYICLLASTMNNNTEAVRLGIIYAKKSNSLRIE